jgi:hypothetical protein
MDQNQGSRGSTLFLRAALLLRVYADAPSICLEAPKRSPRSMTLSRPTTGSPTGVSASSDPRRHRCAVVLEELRVVSSRRLWRCLRALEPSILMSATRSASTLAEDPSPKAGTSKAAASPRALVGQRGHDIGDVGQRRGAAVNQGCERDGNGRGGRRHRGLVAGPSDNTMARSDAAMARERPVAWGWRW